MKASSQAHVDRLAAAVVASLTPELVLTEFRDLQKKSPLGGHCYVASEAAYYLLGGRESDYMPASVMHEGTKHYYLKHRQTAKPLDLTAGQFEAPVPYEKGRGTCYRQTKPSKRAEIVIARALKLLSQTTPRKRKLVSA